MQNIVPRYDPEYNDPKGTVLRKNGQVINLVRLLFNHIGLKGNSRLQPLTSDQKVRYDSWAFFSIYKYVHRSY